MMTVVGWLISLQTIGDLLLGQVASLLLGRVWSVTPWARRKRDQATTIERALVYVAEAGGNRDRDETERTQRILEAMYYGPANS